MQSIKNYATINSDYSVTDTSIINRFIAFKNPFRYRSYYYDYETNLYYLNTRYYDPEIGRFINADDITILDITKNTLNGLNLYTYCLNNPVNGIDESGYLFGWIIALFLLGTAVVGAGIGGKKAYDSGARGWDLAKGILLGGAFGLAIGGAFVAGLGVIAGAFGFSTILGMGVAQIFAIGALAFDFTAFIIAPLFGIDMPGIEYDNPNTTPPYKPPEYTYPSVKTNNLFSSKYLLNIRRKNDRISWRIIKK